MVSECIIAQNNTRSKRQPVWRIHRGAVTAQGSVSQWLSAGCSHQALSAPRGSLLSTSCSSESWKTEGCDSGVWGAFLLQLYPSGGNTARLWGLKHALSQASTSQEPSPHARTHAAASCGGGGWKWGWGVPVRGAYAGAAHALLLKLPGRSSARLVPISKGSVGIFTSLGRCEG